MFQLREILVDVRLSVWPVMGNLRVGCLNLLCLCVCRSCVDFGQWPCAVFGLVVSVVGCWE
jgi:hypothetical protein